MSVNPITRMEHILAGENITPIGRKEYFVQQAVQSGGGSSETYETVAEIEVGEMQFDGSVYMYVFENAETPAFSDGETYYLNSAECHGVASVDDEGTLLLFNTTDMKTLDPTDPSMPSAAISYEKGDAAFASNSDSFANTTITILKKVSAPSGGELPEVTAADNGDVLTVVDGKWDKAEPNPNLKPTYEFGFILVPKQDGGFDVTPDTGVSYSAIRSALQLTTNIKAICHVSGQDAIINNYIVDDDYVVFQAAIFMGETIGWTATRLVINDSEATATSQRLVMQ